MEDVTVIYRKIEYDEIKKVLPLIIGFCNETKAELDEIGSIIGRLEREQTILFMAENGKPCGVVGGYMVGNVGIADFLYVLPEYRKGMIAGRLHKILLNYVRDERGAKKIAMFLDDERLPMYLKIGYKLKRHVVEREV